MADGTERPRPIELFALVAACVACVLHARRYDFVSDDAFIAARYARNLLEGHGLVFQPGERVEGFTSPLWVLLLAALGAAGVDLVTAMRTLSLVGAVGSVLAAYAIARRVVPASSRAFVVYAPALVAAAAPLACWALGGLEQTLFACAALVAASLAVEPAAPRAAALREGAASAVCVLLRPEGLLVAIGLGLARLSTGRRGALRTSLVALAPSLVAFALLTAARLAYYDAWLPNTATAKLAPGTEAFLRGAGYLRGFVGDHGGALVWLGVLALASLPSSPFRVRALAATAGLLMLGVVLVGGDGLAMYRFFVPVLPAFAVLVVAVAGRLHDASRELASPLARRAAPVLLVVTLLALLAVFVRPPTSLAQFQLYREQHDVEIPRWREVGLWLARHTPPDASVACVPIGAIGYYSRRPIVDMVGLTDRHIAALPAGPGQTGHQKHDGPYVLSRRPSILLLGNVEVRATPRPPDDPNFGRPASRAIRAREDDIFTPELRAQYEPRVVRLPSGGYLHYFQRR